MLFCVHVQSNTYSMLSSVNVSMHGRKTERCVYGERCVEDTGVNAPVHLLLARVVTHLTHAGVI